MRKLALVLALAVFVTMGLSACGTKTGGESGAKTKQLVAQIGPNPETIDPALNSSVDGGNMLLFAFDCLLNVDKDNKIIPGANCNIKLN